MSDQTPADDESTELRGRERAMIFRPTKRTLDDGCLGCERSLVYCGSVREIERRACCDICQHS